jgi:transcriptional regulator GlxA family with amidase domain
MRIAILAFDGISPFMLSTPLAVFGEPFLAAGHQVDVCASTDTITATGGLGLTVGFGLEHAETADMVILPGWRSADDPVPDALITTLQRAHAGGAVIVGLCLGAFGLAQARLLTGRRATTHWARAECFAKQFPAVSVVTDVLFIDEGLVVTSAGVASGLDCCLHLLGRFCGVAEANRVARHLVVAAQRGGAQPQLIDRPAMTTDSDQRVTDILEELRSDPGLPGDLDALSARAGMSRRSFTRHVRARTGGSLGDWLRLARIARAQDMLVKGGWGLEQVACQSGFADAGALRAAFHAELGLTPRQWQAGQRIWREDA